MSEKHFFKFRQTSEGQIGQWVVCGPFENYDAAKADRTNSKAWDCELSPIFTASSKEDAEKMPC